MKRFEWCLGEHLGERLGKYFGNTSGLPLGNTLESVIVTEKLASYFTKIVDWWSESIFEKILADSFEIWEFFNSYFSTNLRATVSCFDILNFLSKTLKLKSLQKIELK